MRTPTPKDQQIGEATPSAPVQGKFTDREGIKSWVGIFPPDPLPYCPERYRQAWEYNFSKTRLVTGGYASGGDLDDG